MVDWVAPKNIEDWLRRVFSLRPVFIVLLICLLFISELRFDWIEHALGTYLVTTNSKRPESGAIWEKGRKTQTARRTLEKIVADRQTTQREARNATTIAEVAAQIDPGQGVMLAADHFRTLYLELPDGIAEELISPFDILKLSSEGQWRRVYVEKAANKLTIYLLDENNRVLKQIDLSPDATVIDKDRTVTRGKTLEELANFRNRIYPAARFFDVLSSFPDDVRRSMVPRPEHLLEVPGQINRVGISDETVSGFIEIGFEISEGPRKQIVIIRGHEWAVWRLHSLLEGKTVGSSRADTQELDRTPQ